MTDAQAAPATPQEALDRFHRRREESVVQPRGSLALTQTQQVDAEQTIWGVPGTWAPRADGGSGLTVTATAADGIRVDGELVDGTARLAAMNLLLHGVGEADGPSLIEVKDALIADPGRRWSVVLSNPPFGRKSSLTMVGADGREAREDLEIERHDFVVTTSNKQLNFLQHIRTILEINGRAAVVLPDNVLFEGGAGETLRRRLLREFDLHTMLRLPTGIFYAQGVKANVLFFDKKPAAEHPWTKRLWIYDLRTNQHFTLKQSPLTRAHLDDFVASFLPGRPYDDRVESERFRAFRYDELVARDKANLDITWLRDESLEDLDNLPAPEVIAREIVEDLTAALAEFEAVAAALEAAQPERD